MNAQLEPVEPANLPSNIFGSTVVGRPSGAAVSDAVVQREIAEVQAAVVMAKRFPRNPIVSMDRITQACSRPSLAEVAVYEYARGGTAIDGPSIRLAEAIAQNWGNILSGITIISTEAGKSECIAYAWDLESNYRDEKRFTVRHWRDTKQGGYALKDERDIYELAANQGARRKRACILAVIPGDVIEAALDQVNITMKAKLDITPELIASLLASFEKFNVTKEQIEKRIQRRIDAITPALVMGLKKIHTSLKDGMSKPEDYFDPIEGQEAAGGEPQSRTASVKAAAAKKAEARRPEPAPAAAAQAPAEGGPPPITDEAKALLLIDSAADEGEAAAVLEQCKDQPFYKRIVDAYNARFRETLG